MEKIVTLISNAMDTTRVQAQLMGLLPELEQGKKFECIIQPHRNKRSLDANAYAWVLLDKLAEKLKTTKENIYKEIIKKVGVFEVVCIRENAVDKFIQGWSKNGLGWVAENLGRSKVPNCKNIMLYYGTSTYDTKEMARFIDEIVFECEQAGIETASPDEIANMKSLWESKHAEKNK